MRRGGGSGARWEGGERELSCGECGLDRAILSMGCKRLRASVPAVAELFEVYVYALSVLRLYTTTDDV
jgi:hypothetical protein